MTKQIRALELQDLATLQVGQLRFEKESLGDYLAWMCGQVLTNKLQQNAMVAESSDKLPSKSYKVLLGHLEPTQGIPQLFTDLSSVRTASGELSKQRNKKRALRFGDVFVGATPKNKTDPVPPKYYLVVSQTCDLLQEKLIHGQVLCVEGLRMKSSPRRRLFWTRPSSRWKTKDRSSSRMTSFFRSSGIPSNWSRCP